MGYGGYVVHAYLGFEFQTFYAWFPIIPELLDIQYIGIYNIYIYVYIYMYILGSLHGNKPLCIWGFFRTYPGVPLEGVNHIESPSKP